MQLNKEKSIIKIASAFDKLNNSLKAVIKYGSQASLALLVLGTIIIIVSRTVLNYDAYYEFIAASIVKSSFIILAEIIIGSLLIDYLTKRT